MELTPAQLATLKTDIQGNTDPVVVQALSDGNDGRIADWYNITATPSYWIYKSQVASDEIRDVIDAQNMVDIISADRERVMDMLNLRSSKGFSGENARDRSAWDDVFSAAAGDESQQAIAALWTREGTRGEQVFTLSTGTGADADNADTVSFQGALSYQVIRAALNS